MPRIFLLLICLSCTHIVAAQNIAFQRYYPPMSWSHVFAEADGSFTMIGMSVLSSAAGPSDVMFVKLDSAGNALYYRKINAGYYDDPQYVTRLGNHYLLSGFYGAQYLDEWKMYVLEIDSSGFVVRNGLYGSDSTTYTEGAMEVCANEYGGYTLFGFTYNIGAGFSDMYLIKTDSAGHAIWGKTYGDAGGEGGFYSHFTRTNDNGYLLASRKANSNNDTIDVLLVRTDSAGNILWQKMYGDSGYEDIIYVSQKADGTFFLIGNSSTFDYWNGDLITYHLDSNGNLIEAKKIGTKANAGYVDRTSDGRYLVSGSHNRRPAFMVLDSTGSLTYVTQFDSIIGLSNAAIANDGGYIISGITYAGNWQFFPATYLIRTLPGGSSGCGQQDTIPTEQIVQMPSYPIAISSTSQVSDYSIQFGTFAYGWPEFTICSCNVRAAFSDSVSGNFAYFINESTGASSYEWHFGTSAYSYNASPYIYYYNPGTYTVTLIVRDGICSDTIVHQVTIAAPPVPPTEHFTLYPVPCGNQLTIEYYADSLLTPEFSLYDVTGRLVFKKQLASGVLNSESIDVSFLSNGMYEWRVIGDGEVRWSGKMLKAAEQ